MLYNLNLMNVAQTKSLLADAYDKHGSVGHDMLMRVRITRRTLSVLALHPDWDESEVFGKVQDSFRKGKGSEQVRQIDRELYYYFKSHWLDIIKLEDLSVGKEFEHYAKWSNVKLSQEQYIAKARSKWGDAYDYSESVYIAGLEPITIRCKKHNHYFTVQAGNHICTSGKGLMGGCPICAQERLAEYKNRLRKGTLKRREERERAKNEEWLRAKNVRLSSQGIFLKRATAMYPDYDFSRAIYKDRETNIVVSCPVHGEFKIRPRTLLFGEKGKKPHGCWKCNGITPPYERKFSLDDFKRKMRELYGDKYVFEWSDFKNKQSLIRFTCKKHGEQRRSARVLLEGKGCEYCNGKLWAPDWIKNARAVHGDKYEYDESRPPRLASDYIRYKCPVHGWQETRYDCHVQQGCGCALCAGVVNKLSADERKQMWIEKCKKRYSGKYSYRDVVYVNNDTPVKIYCKEHHLTFETTPDTHLRGAGGCPLCTKSVGEVEIYKWLSEHDVLFETQKKLPNENMFCKRQYLLADFYLPDLNLIIEMNGLQHYQYVEHFNTKDWTFEDQQIRDDTLRAYCKAHKVSLLEIKYDEIGRIPKILAKAIKKYGKR